MEEQHSFSSLCGRVDSEQYCNANNDQQQVTADDSIITTTSQHLYSLIYFASIIITITGITWDTILKIEHNRLKHTILHLQTNGAAGMPLIKNADCLHDS